jgi:hypothetical protein
MQDLSLTKAHIHKRVVETAQVTRVVKLETENSKLVTDNSKLLAELGQTHMAFAKADTTQNSLSLTWGKLEEECVGLRAVVESLGQEKAGAKAAHEAKRKRFQDYRIHHRKKLRELRINLEKVMNEIGGRCLPHPGKGCTIGEIVEWFDKEIWALPSVIMKVKKNFLCYCLARVLMMLYENTYCDHLDGLEAIMNSCDASLLNNIPDEIVKLSGRIVRKWWSSHGLPYVMDIFCVVPEVRVFITCCDV